VNIWTIFPVTNNMIFVLLIPARYFNARSLTPSHNRSYNYTAPIKFICQYFNDRHCQLRRLYNSDGKGMNEHEPPAE